MRKLDSLSAHETDAVALALVYQVTHGLARMGITAPTFVLCMSDGERVVMSGNHGGPDATPRVVALLRRALDDLETMAGQCAHGVKDGEYCETCNRAAKQAAEDYERETSHDG